MKKKCEKETLDCVENSFKIAKTALKKRWKLAFICAKFSVLNPGLIRDRNFERSGITMKLGNSNKDLRTAASVVAKEPFGLVLESSIFKNYHTTAQTLTCVIFEKNSNFIKMMINYSFYQNEVVPAFLKVADKVYFSNQIKLKSFKSYLKNTNFFFKSLKKQSKKVSIAAKFFIFFTIQ